MDYKSYYLNQAGQGLPYFQGVSYQRGYGLGGIFRNIFRWVMPIVKEHALPTVKTFGKELIKSVTNIANDSLNGHDFKDSAKKHIVETVKNTLNNIHKGDGLILKPGITINSNKRKLKRKKKSNSKYRNLDIFDQK